MSGLSTSHAGATESALGRVRPPASPLATYRLLRVGMLFLVLFLGLAVVLARKDADAWQDSVSAYYYTSAHAVFIAVLTGVGMVSIAYRGNSDLEDVLLDYAGFFAFLVALVPTPREPMHSPALPADFDPELGLRVNVLALALAGLGVAAYHVVAGRRPAHRGRAANLAYLAGLLVVAVEVGAFLFAPTVFVERGHGIAAVTLFVAIIAVVAANAWSVRRTTGNATYLRAYRLIGFVMLATLAWAVVTALASHFQAPVLVPEALLIAGFFAFWFVQTRELWGTTVRAPLVTNR